MKFALVIDKSQAFIGFQRERILESWGADAKNSKKISRLNEAGGATLFGGEVTSILTLEDPEAVKQLVSDLEKISEFELSQKVSAGLFISTSVPRTSTKKLETLVASKGGLVVTTAVEKGDKTTTAERLISTLRLNRETRSFLLSYVGDDYEAVIPLVKTLSALSPAQQEKVSENDIYLRLPRPPGALPPWEIEKPILAGSVNDTIETFRRVAEHSHYLVVLKVLNNKFQATYRVGALLDVTKMSDNDLAKTTGVNPRQLWLYKKHHAAYGTEKIQRVVQVLAETERRVKGGSAVDPETQMETCLIQIILILKSR